MIKKCAILFILIFLLLSCITTEKRIMKKFDKEVSNADIIMFYLTNVKLIMINLDLEINGWNL